MLKSCQVLTKGRGPNFNKNSVAFSGSELQGRDWEALGLCTSVFEHGAEEGAAVVNEHTPCPLYL